VSIIDRRIVCYSSSIALLALLECPGLESLLFGPSAVSAALIFEVEDTLAMLNPLGLPLGLSFKLGALGRGLFLARPPTTGISYVMTRKQ